MKERFKDFFLALIPLFQCLPIGVGALLLGSPVAIVFYHMKELGCLWLPILIAYWLFLSVVLWQVHRYRELQEERLLYGDELFFEVYPYCKRIEEREKRLKAWMNRLLARAGGKRSKQTAQGNRTEQEDFL